MANDSGALGQSEIEALLHQAKGAAQASTSSSAIPESMASRRESSNAETASTPGHTQQVAQQPVATATATATPPSTQSGAVHPQTSAPIRNKDSTTSDDIQLLLDQAEQALASANDPAAMPAGIKAFQFRDLTGSPPSTDKATLDLLRDVELDLKIELGRTHMELEELLKLRRGSVVSLDKLAGDPVDVYVNGRLIARGEVLVLNDNFCVRVAELISGDD